MKLSSSARNALPKSSFAGPDRSYPVPDKSHAGNAKARASQAVNEGRMSESTKEHIDAKANAVLHKGAVHPDSKGSHGMHGDGKSHWSGH